MRRVWYGVAGAAVALLAVAGCGYFDVANEETRTYQVDGAVERLVLHDNVGNIEIVAGSGPVRVTETLRYSHSRPTTTHSTTAGTVRLSNSGCGAQIGRCEVDYKIQVPASTATEIDTTTSDVTLTGLAGNVSVQSTTGQITGADLTSPQTRIHATTGDISLTYRATPSLVDCETTTGATRIRVPGTDRYRVDVATTTGGRSVGVPVDAAATNRITAHTTTGDVEVVPS